MSEREFDPFAELDEEFDPFAESESEFDPFDEQPTMLGDLGAEPQSDSLTSQTQDLSTEDAQPQVVRNELKPFPSTIDAGVESRKEFLAQEQKILNEEEKKNKVVRDRKAYEAKLEELEIDKIDEILDQPMATQERAELFNIKNPSITNVEQGRSGQWFRTDVPFIGTKSISEREAAMEIARANSYVAPNFALSRGYGRLMQSFNVLQQQLKLKSPEKFIKTMLELDRIYPEAPENIQKGLKEIHEAEGFVASLKAIVKNPNAVLSVVGESLAVSAPSLATFIGTTFLSGNPIAGAGAGGTITFGTIFGDVLSEEIKKSGVDMNDEEALMNLITDPEFLKRARTRGVAYGLPIAVFDALSMGLAGKIVGRGLKKGSTTAGITARTGAEIGLQATLGGTGELAGQLSEMGVGRAYGFNFRDSLNWGDINLEAFAEIPTGFVEIPTNVVANKKNQKDLEADRKAKVEMHKIITKAYEPPQPNFTAEDKFDQMINELNKLDEKPIFNVTKWGRPGQTAKILEEELQRVMQGFGVGLTTQKGDPITRAEAAEKILEQRPDMLLNITRDKIPIWTRQSSGIMPQEEYETDASALENIREIGKQAPPGKMNLGTKLDELLATDPTSTNQLNVSDIQTTILQLEDFYKKKVKELNDKGYKTSDEGIRNNSPEEIQNIMDELGSAFVNIDMLITKSVDTLRGYTDRAKDPRFTRTKRIDEILQESKELMGIAPITSEKRQRQEESRKTFQELDKRQQDPTDVMMSVREIENESIARPLQMETQNQIQTPGGEKSYGAATIIVDLDNLKQATGELQPRDRTRAESDILATERANPDVFNPARLMESPTTGDGSPIIATEGTIVSGNGRVLTLQKVYARGGQALQNYNTEMRSFLASKGLTEEDINRKLAKFNKPVIVRQLQDKNITKEELIEFAQLSNRSEQAVMSVSEVARRDAQAMSQSLVNLYAGGELTSQINKPFVTQFQQTVLTKAEQGSFTKDGQLTKQAVDRMKSAILAKAFDDFDALSLMLESQDNNIKAISNAFITAAPKLAQLKADIESGRLKPEFDISTDLAAMAKKVSDLRESNRTVDDYFRQQDAFSEPNPIVDALLVAFYNDNFTRARSQKFMEQFLDFYIEEASQKTQEGLFEDTTTPTQLIDVARRKTLQERGQDDTTDQATLFGTDTETTGSQPGTQEGSEQTQVDGSERGRDDAGQIDQESPKKQPGQRIVQKPFPGKEFVSEENIVEFIRAELAKIPNAQMIPEGDNPQSLEGNSWMLTDPEGQLPPLVGNFRAFSREMMGQGFSRRQVVLDVSEEQEYQPIVGKYRRGKGYDEIEFLNDRLEKQLIAAINEKGRSEFVERNNNQPRNFPQKIEGFPQPNENGVYSKDDVKPENLYKTKLPGGAYTEATFFALEIAPGKWIGAYDIQLSTEGQSDGLSGNFQTYNSKEETIKAQIDRTQNSITDRPDDTAGIAKQRKALRKFYDQVLNDIGFGDSPSLKLDMKGELNADTITREENDPLLDEDSPRFTTTREEVVGSTRGSTEGTIIFKEMQTLRQSVFQQAFRDAGFDPDLAVNFTPARQFKILSDLIKDKFGFTVVERGEFNSYNANQSLLDAYRNLQFMAHSLQLPNSTMSLDGEVGLILPSTAAFYNAAYMPKDQGKKQKFTEQDVPEVEAPAIIMPARSNSFAHEWGHALDYYIMERLSPDWHEGITGRIKGKGQNPKPWLDEAPKQIKEAFADLMNAMFFDKAEFSARIMDIEQKIAKLEVKKRTPRQDRDLENLRERLRKAVEEGSAQLRVKKSQYKIDTETFSPARYWSKPTEMFARAFEAYVAQQITARQGTTEFVSKSDEAYQLTIEQVTGADERLALTYPKGETRDNIFLAMDRLMEAIRTQFNNDIAERPGDYDMIDQRLDFAGQVNAGMERKAIKEIIKEEKAAFKNAQVQKQRESERPIRFEDLGTGAKAKGTRSFRSIEDQVLNNVLYTKRGIMFRIADRYGKHPFLNRQRVNEINKELKNNKNLTPLEREELRAERDLITVDKKQKVRNILENIIRRVATDPGGRRRTFTGGVFEEAVRTNSRRFATRYKEIIDKYNLGDLNTQEMEQLRKILTADTDEQAKALRGEVPARFIRAAGEIRNKILNPIYDYTRKGGVNLRYLEDGSYMPRLLDKVLVFGRENEFLYGKKEDDAANNPSLNKGAYGLYHQVIYVNEVGNLDIGNIDQAQDLISMARRSKLKDDPRMDTLKERIRLFSNAVTELKTAQRLKEETEKRNKNKQDGQPQESTEQFDTAIEEAQQTIEEMHEDIYNSLRPIFADVSAKDWLMRLHISTGQDMDGHTAQNSFMKQRKLPKEADSFMVDFYMDVIDSLNTYIPAVVRKVETDKRFGVRHIPKGKRRNPVDNSVYDYLSYALDQAKIAGMDHTDAEKFKLVVDTILGRTGVSKDSKAIQLINKIHAFGTMALLPRAVMSSIAEPLTIGINTGSSLKAIQNFFIVFDGAFGMVRNKNKERTLFFRQMANILGVVDEPTVGEMVANRLGGSVMEDPKLNARVNRFFVRTKLQGLTNAQRRSSMRVWLQFLTELSHEYRAEDTQASRKKAIENIMQDLGITAKSIDQFTSFMAESKDGQFKAPNLEDVMEANGELSDMGSLLSTAMNRAVSMTIQDPMIVDRPMYAEHPVGRLVFGIQSFMNAFTRNILIASAKKVARETKDNGYASGATMLGLQMIPNFALFYGGHFLISTMREYLFNSDAIEREKEDDNLAEYLLELGLLRSGLTGKFDPFINMYKSLRYEADAKTILVGASLSFYFRAAQRMLGYFVKNSENTIAAEYQAVRGFYDIFVTTAISLMASAPGLGPIGGTVAGVGSMYASSPEFKHYVIREFIKLAYGEEYFPGRKKKKENWAR